MKKEFWMAIHNFVAHPLMQLMWWVSLCGKWKRMASWGEWIHDVTYPEKEGE
jgi:hypothetical protein